MKVSLPWLQNFFEKPLPPAEAAEEALTFHAFEIEEREGDVLDVNVLPDRAGYALCHRGVAAELAAILAVPMKDDPLRAPLPLWPKTHALTVQREDSTACPRYIGALVRGVKVGPSPAWLKEALESVGQRSINAIVDATNYVMLNVGQPLHAFDAGKIAQENGTYKIAVRGAREGEHITTLADSTLTLPRGTLLIADGVSGAPLGIAGVKGGSMAAVDDHTTDLIIEAASFDGPTVRRAAQQLKLFTDASLRFQNKPSPELAAYGMRDVLALITSLAGGEVEGVIDVSAPLPTRTPISLSLEKVNAVLGTSFSQEKVEDIFMRLGLSVSYKDGMFVVEPPFERTDLVIPEDLIEEVGRIGGYDAIEPVPLPASPFPPDQARFRGIERIRDFLVDKGFTEISTQAFAKKGDITLANPFDKTKPALRTSLRENGEEVLRRAKQYAPRVLSPHQEPRLLKLRQPYIQDRHLNLEDYLRILLVFSD